MFKNIEEENYNVSFKNGIVIAPTLKTNLPAGLGYFILDACDKYSNQNFQSCPYENKSITFKDFKTTSINLAANLQSLYNLQKGDVIISCMQNSLQCVLPTAAIWYLGGIASFLDPTLSANDCQHMISIVQPKIIFLDESALLTIQTALTKINLKPILIINEYKSKPKSNEDVYTTLAELLSPVSSQTFKPLIIKDFNTPATILFSSGTTGLPKGICLSHMTVYQGGIRFMNLMNYPNVITYCTSLYWISGLLMFTGSFLNGTIRITLRQFEINTFCEAVERYKVTSTFLGTSYLNKLLQAKDRVDDFITLKDISLGGSSATKQQFESLGQAFPHITFNTAYGMTETAGPNCFFSANHRQALKKYPDSCGLPSHGFSIKIVDPKTEQILQPFEKGEIRIKFEYPMLGYYNNTADNPFDNDKFIKSGDIGYLDENHYLYVCGRNKDTFKYQSWHIVPASIEAIIQEHPAVDEVIVFGLPDNEDVGSFLPSAAILLKESYRDILPEMIETFSAERVADRQRLRGGIYFVKEMPKTPTGKIQRAKVQDIVIKQLKIV